MNLILLFIFLPLLAVLLCQYFLGADSKSFEVELPAKPQDPPLTNSFVQKSAQYSQVGTGFLQLEKNTIKANLPDLRLLLLSYGPSKRADNEQNDQKVAIGFRNQPAFTVAPGEKLYLKCEVKQGPPRWIVSENNQPTNIWLTPEISEGEVLVALVMLDIDGKEVKEPYDQHYFVLRREELSPLQANLDLLSGWQIGRDPVDSTLLTKQKAKWLGQDLFLDMYGGQEYAFTKGRERLDFESPDFHYPAFVKENDLLVFEDGLWQNVEAGEKSRGKSLLEVKKINNESILFHLWDPDGKKKIALLLPKTQEPPKPQQNLELRLVGAKSRKEWIADIGNKRMSISPTDWLVVHDGQCEKITTEEQLDDYLYGNLKGDLIVLEGIKKVGSDLCLVGNMFNDTRCKVFSISAPLYKAPVPERKGNDEALQNRQRIENGRAHKQVDDDDDEYDDEEYDDDDDDEDDDDDYI